jgi:hypothetical protein
MIPPISFERRYWLLPFTLNCRSETLSQIHRALRRIACSHQRRMTGWWISCTGSHIVLSATESSHVLVFGPDRRLQVSQTGTLEWQSYLLAASHKRFHEIVLEDCSVSSDCLLRVLSASRSRLRRLSLYNVRLEEGPDGLLDTWMSIFVTSRIYLLVLESCKLGNLWDKTNGHWLEGGDKTIEASTRAQVSTVISNLAAGNRTFRLNG